MHLLRNISYFGYWLALPGIHVNPPNPLFKGGMTGFAGIVRTDFVVMEPLASRSSIDTSLPSQKIND